MQQGLELFRDYAWSAFANAWQYVSFAGEIACTELRNLCKTSADGFSTEVLH